jgi:hypothetical protein
MRPLAPGLALLPWLLLGDPLLAGAPEDEARAARMIENERHYFDLARPVTGCSSARSNDEIVVCATRRPDPRYDPPPPRRRPDAKAIAFGAPPAGRGVGASVTIRGCFLQKCPRKLYFIDLKAIPEAPPGSDAAKIARGEMRAH